MNSTETIELSGNATQLIAAYKAANQAQDEMRKKAKEISDETKKAAQEEARLTREAKKALEDQKPARERLNAEILRYNDLVKKGKVTQDEANAAIAKQTKIVEEGESKIRGFAGATVSFGKEAITAFTGVGSAIAGVLATVRLVKAEYDDMIRRNKESLDSQLSFGDAIREMAVNFGEDATMKRGDLESVAMGIAKRTGATPETVAQVMGPTLSAKGDLTNSQAADVVEQALRVLPTNAEASKQLASRAADLMAAGGVDAKSAIGVLSQAQQKARVTNLRDLGQSGVPAIVSTMMKGDSLESSAELFTTINALMNDAEGNRSRTATEALNVRLAEFAPSRKGKDSKGAFGVSQEALDAFSGARTTSERIAVMRQYPDLRRSFLGAASFELGAQASIESLLSGDARAMSIERGVQAGISAPNASVFEGFVGGLNAMASGGVGASGRASAANLKQAELADATGGQAGLAQQIFDDTINKIDFAGPDAVHRFFASDNLEGRVIQGQSRASAAADILGGIRASASPGDDQRIVKLLESQEALLRQIANKSTAVPPENPLGRPP